MLQQTRVEAVIPYYERFLGRFPTAADFAAASEQDVLAAWAGLGYYSRARNLQRAAQTIVEAGGFPASYDAIRGLAGVGPYTAAAVASIAFGLPHAALDGNVARVLARVTNDAGDVKSPVVRARLQEVADAMLDRRRPGDFNQAVMELGAIVCVPRDPKCPECPVSRSCAARQAGRERELPVRARARDKIVEHKTVFVILRAGKLLLWQRGAESARLGGFWELPETGIIANIEAGECAGEFRHRIVNHEFHVTVRTASIRGKARPCVWVESSQLDEIPLSTTAKKAVLCFEEWRSKPLAGATDG